MKVKTTAAVLATAALGCLATPAFAQDAMVAAPEDQSAEIEFLKAQLESMQAQIADLQKAKKSSAPTFKGSPLFGDKEAGWDFKVRGRLQYRSEEHTSELQSLMRISYAVFCLKKKIKITNKPHS